MLLATHNGLQFDYTFTFPFLKELAKYTGKTEQNILGFDIINPLTATSSNVIRGVMNDRNFAVFDQNYQSGTYKNKSRISQTFFAVEILDLNLPFFCLEPDSSSGFLEWKVERFDINFPTHPNFSHNHLLYGQNEYQIRSLFTPSVLNFYEQKPVFTTIAGGKHLVIYQHGQTCLPEQVLGQLQFLYSLIDIFKYRR
ncbi:MAG TPA: hypothetical protein PKE69_01855 [Pyrinomonadaceae bacterium]|nr:hypothetical protein [Pyrinomonadaceae bacterium]